MHASPRAAPQNQLLPEPGIPGTDLGSSIYPKAAHPYRAVTETSTQSCKTIEYATACGFTNAEQGKLEYTRDLIDAA
jgi:hypothetical protein